MLLVDFGVDALATDGSLLVASKAKACVVFFNLHSLMLIQPVSKQFSCDYYYLIEIVIEQTRLERDTDVVNSQHPPTPKLASILGLMS